MNFLALVVCVRHGNFCKKGIGRYNSETMKYTTTTIPGSGRGKMLGFPTINMNIPDNLPLQLPQGVYSAHAQIGDNSYKGALYYGPASTFGEHDPRLEIYLFDTAGLYVGPGESIAIEIGKHIREPKTFELPELLLEQITKDITQIEASI